LGLLAEWMLFGSFRRALVWRPLLMGQKSRRPVEVRR